MIVNTNNNLNQLKELIVTISAEQRKTHKKDLVEEFSKLYDKLIESIPCDNYIMVELTEFIFIEFRTELFIKNKTNSRSKSKNNYFQQLFAKHIRKMSQSKINIKNLNWPVYYSNLLLCDPFISDSEVEFEQSECFMRCVKITDLHWINPNDVKNLLNSLLTRISKQINSRILYNYCYIIKAILSDIHIFAIDRNGPCNIVRRIFESLKLSTAANSNDPYFWKQIRGYSYISIIEFIADKYGMEARDIFLIEVPHLMEHFLFHVIGNRNDGNFKEKVINLGTRLVDLAMMGDGKVFNRNMIKGMRKFVYSYVSAIWGNIYYSFLSRKDSMIDDTIVSFLARLLKCQLIISTSKSKIVTFMDILSCSFNGISHWWRYCIQLSIEMIDSLSVDIAQKCLSILWSQRISFKSDDVRDSFLKFLGLYLKRFGSEEMKAPSILCIFNYSVNLIHNNTCESAAQLLFALIENFGRVITIENIYNLLETLLNIENREEFLLKLISVVIANYEFSENWDFKSTGNAIPVCEWKFRKTIIDWILLHPNSCSHKLLHQLCVYNPAHYLSEEYATNKRTHLMKNNNSNLKNTVNCVYIDEVVKYTEAKLKSHVGLKNENQFNIDIVIIMHEFCKAFGLKIIELPDNIVIISLDQNLEKLMDLSCLPDWLRWNEKWSLAIKCYFIVNCDVNMELKEEKKDVIDVLKDMKQHKILHNYKFVWKLVIGYLEEIAFDIYQMVYRFQDVCELLNVDQLTEIKKIMMKHLRKFFRSNSINESDFNVLFTMINTCLVEAGLRIDYSEFNSYLFAKHPLQFKCLSNSDLKKAIKKLYDSPLLAKNIVEHYLGNQLLWEYHPTILKEILKNKCLLSTCLLTVKNIRKYFEVYQIHFKIGKKLKKFLCFQNDGIGRCRNYLKNPQLYSKSLIITDLQILFGLNRRYWKRAAISFWKMFAKYPQRCCRFLRDYTIICLEIGLSIRWACLFEFIVNNEFSKISDEVFAITYHSIYNMLLKDALQRGDYDLFKQLIDRCSDDLLVADYVKNRVQFLDLSQYLDKIKSLQLYVERSINEYLKNGRKFTKLVMNNKAHLFIEFYKLLNKTLKAEILEENEKKCIYWNDFLSFAWLYYKEARPTINIIAARFRYLSSLWKTFPHPPHSVTDIIGTSRIYCEFSVLGNVRDSDEFEVLLSLYKLSFGGGNVGIFEMEIRDDCLNGLRHRHKFDSIVNQNFSKVLLTAASNYKDIALVFLPFFLKYVKVSNGNELEEFLRLKDVITKDELASSYCLARCIDSIGLDAFIEWKGLNNETNLNFLCSISNWFIDNGFYSHAFAICNIVFDNFCSDKRGMIMINRIPMNSCIPDKWIDILKKIYIKEQDSDSLDSLPPNVHSMPEVQRVVLRSKKKWNDLMLMDRNEMDGKEKAITKWMCGLCTNECTNFLESILASKFDDYPKKIDDVYKLVYLIFYHSAVSDYHDRAKDFLKKATSTFLQKSSIEETRLLLVSSGSIEAVTIEEKIIWSIGYLRRAQRLMAMEYGTLTTDNMEKVSSIVRYFAEELNAPQAALQIVNMFKMQMKNNANLNRVSLIEYEVRCQLGEHRFVEMKLNDFRVCDSSADDYAKCWLKFCECTKHRDIDESITRMEKIISLKQLSDEVKLRILLKYHETVMDKLTKLEEYRETYEFRSKIEAVNSYEKQLKDGRMDRETERRIRLELKAEREDLTKFEAKVSRISKKCVSSGLMTLVLYDKTDDKTNRTDVSFIIFPLIDVLYKFDNREDIAEELNDYATYQMHSFYWIKAIEHISSKLFLMDSCKLNAALDLMIRKLITDYPYNVLYRVFVYEHLSYATSSKIKTMFKELAETSSELYRIIRSMRFAHKAYIQFCVIDVKTSNVAKVNNAYQVPANLLLHKCIDQQVPIPFVSQPIGEPRDYSTDGLIMFQSIASTFTIANGLSAPKILEVTGTNGAKYLSVWKCDDVRQDILVQHLFDVMNNLLDSADRLRTYNVVALNEKCGIIEFCSGTKSLKELFVDDDRIEQCLIARKKMTEALDSSKGSKDEFLTVCESLTPIFRNIFYKFYPTCNQWHRNIEKYRRSLATWSIVCYIVGLGDRHLSNILFDLNKAEYVHIDLGMVFEYSKRLLPIPERVPFRLTREMMDPILIGGLENGKLVKLCANVLDKFKQNRKVVLGVTSILLQGRLTNFKESKSCEPNRPSSIARTAIGRLSDKLSPGSEEKSLYEVRRLLLEASETLNLSRIFPGWMPFI